MCLALHERSRNMKSDPHSSVVRTFSCAISPANIAFLCRIMEDFYKKAHAIELTMELPFTRILSWGNLSTLFCIGESVWAFRNIKEMEYQIFCIRLYSSKIYLLLSWQVLCQLDAESFRKKNSQLIKCLW